MASIKGIAHVGIALNQVDKAISLFETYFGSKLILKVPVPDQKQNSAMVSVGKDILEIMEPTDENSVVGKFIKSRGEGIHHISLDVEGLADLIVDLEKKGAVILGKQLEGKERIAFLHPKNTFGVLFELREEIKG